LPLPHSIDDLRISMNSSVDSFLPTAVFNTVISTTIRIKCLRIWHRLSTALSALFTYTFAAITSSIRDRWSSVVFESIGWQDQLDLPIAISSVEQLFFEFSMLVYIFFFDKDGTFISHISAWWAWVLIIMTIKTNC